MWNVLTTNAVLVIGLPFRFFLLRLFWVVRFLRLLLFVFHRMFAWIDILRRFRGKNGVLFVVFMVFLVFHIPSG